jgi:hypothetical protein
MSEEAVRIGGMTKHDRDPLYCHHRFPAEVIAHAVWLYFRFPLSLRMVEDMLATRGIIVTHQTIRNWAEKFGRQFARDLKRRSTGRFGDKLALGRMHGHHQWQEAVALAGRRSRWFRPGRARADPPEMRKPPSGCCESFSKSRAVHRV